MAIIVREAFTSRSGLTSRDPGRSTAMLNWHVGGTQDKAAARAAVLSTTPAMYDAKLFRSVRLTPIAPTAWHAECSYDDAVDALDVGEWRFSFDTTGGTVRQLVGLEERRYPATAPDQDGAINVQDGKVQGLDVPVGGLRFTIHFRQPNAVITIPYARKCASMVGKTNLEKFYVFEPREVMFLGVTGQQGSAQDPVLDYSFLAGEHREDVVLGGITVDLKEAHEYLWAAFEDGVDANRLIQEPYAIYVDKVAEEVDFAELEIGGSIWDE